MIGIKNMVQGMINDYRSQIKTSGELAREEFRKGQLVAEVCHIMRKDSLEWILKDLEKLMDTIDEEIGKGAS